MGSIVFIGLGGMIGAILRYFLGAQAQDYFKSVTFPFGTLVVKALGCLVIGVLSYFVENRGALTAETRLLLITGLLSSFTTFSSFSLETVNLISGGQWPAALANIAANNVLGLAAVWIGRVTPLLIWR
ncbi:MAG: fluoride efflux transporter CrcB [Anaerolineales bacterium]